MIVIVFIAHAWLSSSNGMHCQKKELSLNKSLKGCGISYAVEVNWYPSSKSDLSEKTKKPHKQSWGK